MNEVLDLRVAAGTHHQLPESSLSPPKPSNSSDSVQSSDLSTGVVKCCTFFLSLVLHGEVPRHHQRKKQMKQLVTNPSERGSTPEASLPHGREHYGMQ